MTVHHSSPDATPALLSFWYGEVGAERWFAADAALDREIARRFEPLRVMVLADRAQGWRTSPGCLLAAIILLDQFSRNVHRGTRRAFEADGVARELAWQALDSGWTHAAAPDHRHFLLMPLMHSENLSDQQRSVAEFQRHGDAALMPYALGHRDQILRFGRFPARNRALGRVSTPAERDALERGEIG